MNKEMLTKEKCQKDIVKEIVAAIPLAVAYCIATLVFSFPAIIIPLSDDAFETPFSIFMFVFFSLFGAFLVFTNIRGIVILVKRYIMAKKGSFVIVEDTLNYMEEKPVRHGYRYRLGVLQSVIEMTKGHYTETVFKLSFDKHKYCITERFLGILDYSTPGDKFYLLLSNPKSKKAIAAYNTKFYTLEETANL